MALLVYCGSFLLQLRKTSLDTLAVESREHDETWTLALESREHDETCTLALESREHDETCTLALESRERVETCTLALESREHNETCFAEYSFPCCRACWGCVDLPSVRSQGTKLIVVEHF